MSLPLPRFPFLMPMSGHVTLAWWQVINPPESLSSHALAVSHLILHTVRDSSRKLPDASSKGGEAQRGMLRASVLFVEVCR
jgi:hypothetical protein